MSTTACRWVDAQHATWLVLLIGLGVMYVPTFTGLFQGIWATAEQGHGPIVLCLSLWLIWRKWPALDSVEGAKPQPFLAWPLLVLGGLMYALGHSQNILVMEVGSLIIMITGCVLLMRGVKQLKSIWFALFFMLFLVPLPGAFVDTLTLPMKLAVSRAAENLLYVAGYPVGSRGVTIQIGPYRLLVADACAGLHTLFSLEALGLLYLNVVRTSSSFRNLVLAVLIVPISFAANVSRVVALTLTTYHFGDAVGQGFTHKFAGIALFLSVLLLMIGADSILRWIDSAREKSVTL